MVDWLLEVTSANGLERVSSFDQHATKTQIKQPQIIYIKSSHLFILYFTFFAVEIQHQSLNEL